ncbi:MAG: hypothetical protein OXE82_04800 [Rhodobacter sp.]|nr:hypothetical protein [Rhodobacter sp.]
MTNTSLLKKGKPPLRRQSSNVIAADPRPAEHKNKALQVMVPPEVFEAFSARAGEEFGFSKGAKSKLFMEMWRRYYSMKQ